MKSRRSDADRAFERIDRHAAHLRGMLAVLSATLITLLTYFL
jgi:hypothetical protein